MTVTPWGDSEHLRSMKLPPGPAHSPQKVAENQRNRLLAAMVASTAARGYEETGVADLAEISGVSPRSFYQHFESKEACLLAALEEILSLAVESTLTATEGGDWREEGHNRIVAFASFVAAQPAAARLFLVEAYAAGPNASETVDDAILKMERVLKKRLEDLGLPQAVPQEMLVGAIGAAIAGARIRLLRGHLERLPEFADELASFLLQFEPPARPLRVAARPPERRPEEREAGDHAERALRAFEALLAERGLPPITMGQVAERAGMSVRTLYANFSSREELMLGAVDAAAMQSVAVMLPAYRRAPSPADGVRAAFSALFGMLASRPNLAHLLLAGTREGGAPALERRAEVLRQIEPLLSVGVPAHQRPVSIRVASEAVLNAVLEVGARRLADSGAEALPGLVPICSFMILAPVLGTEQATAAAEGKGYRKPPPAVAEAVLRAAAGRMSQQLITTIAGGPKTVAELEEASSLSAAQVADQIRTLEAQGVIAALEPAPGSRAPRYASAWARLSTKESGEMTRAEREVISLEVGQVIKAEVEEAFQAGTFDARADRSLIRLPMRLDDQGWSELSQHLDDSLDTALEIQRRASERLLAGGDAAAGTYGRLLFATFEVPHPEGDAG
ncbi:MAG: TetR/AcrR family transcriptional regulator [Actinobacteria bacterium]|nr:MAG: TetR/AcrR family transcriptional regulator [Actinomycetota bacterium]